MTRVHCVNTLMFTYQLGTSCQSIRTEKKHLTFPSKHMSCSLGSTTTTAAVLYNLMWPRTSTISYSLFWIFFFQLTSKINWDWRNATPLWDGLPADSTSDPVHQFHFIQILVLVLVNNGCALHATFYAYNTVKQPDTLYFHKSGRKRFAPLFPISMHDMKFCGWKYNIETEREKISHLP